MQHSPGIKSLWRAGVLALMLCSAAARGQRAVSPSAATPDSAAGANANASSDTSPNERAPAVKLNSSDQEFFQKAAASGLAEVAAGQMAAAQASGDEVKTFGRQMVRDHGKANEELKQLAAGYGLTLPTMPDTDHQKVIDRLKQKEGGQFDDAYVESQVDDHETAVSLFEKASKSKDAGIKAFAQKTLPVLKEHLTMIKALKSKLKKSS